MASEKINQIEFPIVNNDEYLIKLNLITGRLLVEANVINLFKDEYNLSLNLLYNSKNEFNPNMNSSLGNYYKLDINEYKFLWVVEFPLFEYSEEEDRWVAAHHPFTCPKDEFKDMLLTLKNTDLDNNLDAEALLQ